MKQKNASAFTNYLIVFDKPCGAVKPRKMKGSIEMKDLRFKFSIFNKFYFGIYNKIAAETATLQKNKFVSIHKNPFLQGYVIEIIL